MALDFHALAKKEKNATMKLRLLAVAHFSEGLSRYKIASALKVSRGSVNKWIALYLAEGLDGLIPKKSPGRPYSLSLSQRQQLSRYIEEQSTSAAGGRLIAKDIQAYIENEFSVQYEVSNIYRLLDKLGFSWVTSRSRHPKQSDGVQKDFKKTDY